MAYTTKLGHRVFYLFLASTLLLSNWIQICICAKFMSAAEIADLPICLSRASANNICENDGGGSCSATSGEPRIVVIGDVQGDFDGLLDVLEKSNVITASQDGGTRICSWAPQSPEGTVLLQIGDIVDRGPYAMESWKCLEQLQDHAPEGSKVVRIIGNHEVTISVLF